MTHCETDARRSAPDGRGGRILALGAVLAALVLTACGGSGGGPSEAEDHEHAGAVVTTWTDSLELFMEYPPQVAGMPGDPWAIHLTRLEGWRPVGEGSLTLFFTGPDGSAHTVRAEAPSRPGIYTPAPTLPAPGDYRLAMVLESGGRRHEIPAGRVTVHASEGDLPHSDEETVGGEITLLKEQQWEIPFRVAEVRRRPVAASIRATGQLTAPDDRTARISAPVTGLVEIRGGGTALPGRWVEEGDVLAVLAPTDADASYARLRGRVESLEREVSRAERLVEVEAIAEKRLVEARHELSVARSALAAIGGEAPDAADEREGYRFYLRSPITGVVSERRLSPGQRVEAGERVFTVVDPRTLWLRLKVPADEAARAAGATGASFRVEGSEALHRATSVVAVGDVIDPDSRTLPVILGVDNADRELKVGMLGRARLFVGDTVSGPAVPNEAIRDEDGMKVAYVETGGETFERRVLELGPSDGEWTLVRSGLSAGERVVTDGAYQVHLASAGGDEAATGHGHPH
jgi:RND family efflux transporter MFP subunit